MINNNKKMISNVDKNSYKILTMLFNSVNSDREANFSEQIINRFI